MDKEKLSKSTLKLIKRAEEMKEITPTKAGNFSMYPRSFTYVPLPHREPRDTDNPSKKALIWQRKSGNHTLNIQSGVYIDRDGKQVIIGIPYGALPRILIAFMTNELLKNKKLVNRGKLPKELERRIILGDTFKSFLGRMGLYNSGGKRGDGTRLKKQMERLFSAIIIHEYKTDLFHSKERHAIVSKELLWWSPKDIEQISIFNSYIEVNRDFYDNVLKNSFPIYERALIALRSSPLALDYYTFFTRRLPKLNRDLFLTWGALKEQFGTEYKSMKEFSRESRKQIKRVLAVYPKARIEFEIGKIRLQHSPPHVHFKKK